MAISYSSIVIMLVGLLSQVAAVDNCFFDNHLTFAYNIPDTSGNYTSVKEYWMRMDTTCEFNIDTDTMMTWYSSDISVNTLKYWQTLDGDCKAPDGADPMPYEWGTPLVMGSEDVVTEINPVPQEGVLCLVKYQIVNANDVHDMRVQLFKIGDEHDEDDGSIYLRSTIAVVIMSVLAFTM